MWDLDDTEVAVLLENVDGTYSRAIVESLRPQFISGITLGFVDVKSDESSRILCLLSLTSRTGFKLERGRSESDLLILVVDQMISL